MRVWSAVAEMLAAHGTCALVTVASVRGSAPREAGARMVVGPDGGFRGTVGGGELEWRAIRAARDSLSRKDAPAATLRRFALGPDLGQCCGGSVRVLNEVFGRDRLDEVRVLAAREAAGPFGTRGQLGAQNLARAIDDTIAPDGPTVEIDGDLVLERFRDLRHPVWLFGAGHVGRALMLALAPLPFDLTWIDEREGIFPAALPARVRAVTSADPAAELGRAPSGASVVVMTHHHPLDLAIVHAALAADRFGYVGLIGSKAKRARFASQLRKAGMDEERIAALVCPVGMPSIRSKLPAAIATGIAAQLLERVGP